MDDISLIIESMTPEQYKKLFKDLPVSSITINHNRDKYIEELSNNIYQKKILNTMLNNNFNISSVSDNSISILVDLNNGKIIKYLKEHLDKTNIDINIKGLNSNVLGVNIKFSNERDMQIFNQILENYYLVNKSNFNKESYDYILKMYQETPKEYLDYIAEMNKNEIEFLKEKHLQETTLPFNSISNVKVSNENEVSIKDIYTNDSVFNKIPFDKLTQEQKYTMCNKYCQWGNTISKIAQFFSFIF